MHFYIIDGSEQKGPMTADQINESLSLGSIDQSTLIWFEGLSEWSPIEKFAHFFPKAENSNIHPTNINAIPDNAIRAKKVSPKWKKIIFGLHHPWRRYFARFVDIYLFGLWWFFIFGILLEKVSYDLHKHLVVIVKDGIFDGPLALLLWMPIEVTLISLFGTTPGKLVFGIFIKNNDGNNLTLLDSSRRYISMVVSGLACGFPFLVFLANLWACKRLESEGCTSWDTAANSIVIHSEKMIWRYFLGAIGVFLALLSLVILRA